MKVRHRKILSDRWTYVRRDSVRRISTSSWATDGTEVTIDFEMDGRQWYMELDRAEGEALLTEMLNWYLTTKAGS